MTLQVDTVRAKMANLVVKGVMPHSERDDMGVVGRLMSAWVLLMSCAAGFAAHAEPDYLRFVAKDGDVEIMMAAYGSPLPLSLECSTDLTGWRLFAAGEDRLVARQDEPLYFRAGSDRSYFTTDKGSTNAWMFVFLSTNGATVVAGGNAMSLVDPTCQAKELTAKYAFARLFYGCELLIQPPELPATSISHSVYYQMFRGCSRLRRPPDLPSENIAPACYASMFQGCGRLESAPALPATKLYNSCYFGMFMDCTSLRSPPELPARDVATNCYYQMFKGCTALKRAPELLATRYLPSCYYEMFRDCKSLTVGPLLRPTDMTVPRCCYGLFNGCSSLRRVRCNTSKWVKGPAETWLDGTPPHGIYEGTGIPYRRESWSVPESWLITNGKIYNCIVVPKGENLTATVNIDGDSEGVAPVEETAAWCYLVEGSDLQVEVRFSAIDNHAVLGETYYCFYDLNNEDVVFGMDERYPLPVSRRGQLFHMEFEEGVLSVRLSAGDDAGTVYTAGGDLWLMPGKVYGIDVTSAPGYRYIGLTQITMPDEEWGMVFAAEPILEGAQERPWRAGENVFVYRRGDELIFEGTGKMYDFDDAGQIPWSAVAGEIRSLLVGDGVEIGRNCLSGLGGVEVVNGVRVARLVELLTALGYRFRKGMILLLR